MKPQIIRGDQPELDAVLLSHRCQAVAPPVEVPVKAAGHAVPMEQIQDLLAPVPLIQGRIVQEAVFLPLPRRLQGGLQPDQLPVEDLGTVPASFLLVEPAPGAAQGDVSIEMAVVVEQLKGRKPIFLKKRSILAAVVHQ